MKPTPVPVISENIPQSLKNIDRWVLWKYELVTKKTGDKWNKVPYKPNGQMAKTVEASSWSTFDQVIDAYTLGDWDGIGLCFNGSDDVHGFDIDDCIIDGKLDGRAKELLDRVDGYAEVSPSGTGIKLFTISNLKAGGSKPEAEAYRDGRYFTVTGQVVQNHKDLPDCIQDVAWFEERYFGTSNVALYEGKALALYKPPLPDWTIELVESDLLSSLNPDCSYGEWISIGQAMYHQGRGDAAWLKLWDKWSATGESYEPGLCEIKWRSFSEQRDRGNGPITLASVIKLVKDIRQAEQKRIVETYRERIEAAQTADQLQGEICADIQKDFSLSRFNRDILAQLLKSKFKELGCPVSLTELKKLIRLRMSPGVPDWLEGWTFLTHEDRFVNVHSKQKVTATGFNAMFDRFLIESEAEPNAAKLALQLWKIPACDKMIYLPWAPDMFEFEGKPCINAYNSYSVPDVPADYSRSDIDAIETVKRHIELTLPEHGAANIFISWMAHNVQRPGVKILWAPLIKGIQGDGKSLLGKIMDGVMGTGNVGLVTVGMLSSSFTSWASGHCVNVLEEIRLSGHNRHEIMNGIKEYITNDFISVHPKGVDPYKAPNTTNYMAFTNHADALPLDDTDRRWWVNFTPWSSPEELAEVMNNDYFDKLHAAINGHIGTLRKWLMEWEIPESFRAKGRAPTSSAKLSMIAMNTSDDESTIRDLIDTGACGVSSTVLSTSHLSAALAMMDDVEVPHTKRLAGLLMKIGFTKLLRPVKWRGVKCHIWVRGSKWGALNAQEENARVRELLDRTIVDPMLE